MMSDLEKVQENLNAWLALLVWQSLPSGLYQAAVEAYEEWERVCPKDVSTEKVIAGLREKHPELIHETRR
jgi:hypothetical protein